MTPDAEHRYNLPEGVRYDLQGKGLIMDGAEEVPVSSNPLETLNESNPLDTLNQGLENR